MNTLHPDQVDALSRLPSLKGAPLSIFVAMLIAQQPLQASELETYTGLANGAVTKGLKRLTDLKAVINLGRRGWILSPNWQQLTLPLQFLVSGSVNHEKRDLDHEKRDLPPLLVSCLVDDLEEDALTNQPTSAANHEKRDLRQSVEKGPKEVEHWLEQGGIVPNSPKMRLLVQKIQSPEYAKAHVLEHLYQRMVWEKGGKRDREPGAGALIYRLEQGWSAPHMRCPECLRLERSCTCNGYTRQEIPDDLLDIIRR